MSYFLEDHWDALNQKRREEWFKTFTSGMAEAYGYHWRHTSVGRQQLWAERIA